MSIQETIIELSHAHGAANYVRGGGGNSSCKDETTLWVKPSGTTLRDLEIAQLVALDRRKVSVLETAEPPEDASAREAFVLDVMMGAVLPDSSGRPSVEAPLHNTFRQRYVVHTHPPLVNGMTCGRDGAAACAQLFPEALWIAYIDPGYTLCGHVHEAMSRFEAEHGHQPQIVMLENHGVFVAADTAEEISTLYVDILARLEAHYAAAHVPTTLVGADSFDEDRAKACRGRLRSLLGEGASVVKSGPRVAVSEGPLTPDHVVYAGSFPLQGQPDREAVDAYSEKYGRLPFVVQTDNAVHGLGNTEKTAGLALEFAMDAALVVQLADAFGGVKYMDERARLFIENWEVEAYRKKVSTAP